MNSTNIDLVIRIKNGYMAEKEVISALYSKLNENILTLLKKKGYIANFKLIEDGNKKSFTIELKYDNRTPAVRDIKLFSRPGRRDYIKLQNIKPVLGGLGISIVSTSKGIMTDSEARDKKVGGEILFSIW